MVKKSASAPTIRFSSFSDDWEQQHLKTFFTPSRAKGNDGMPTLSVTINSGLVNRDELERKQLTNLTAEEHLLVRTGDIAYNMMRMWQGAFGRATTDGIVSPAYVVLRGKKNVDTRFFEYAFRRSRSIYLFWAYSYGLTKDRLRLYANDFTRIPFSAPKLLEQEKIADFLTAVDRRISQLVEKKAILEDYKKGVMQQLFSQAIRFKDDEGKDFPDWEEKRYDSIYSFKNTNSYSRDLLTYEGGEVRNIHYGDIHTKFKTNFVLNDELVPFIKPDVDLARIAEECYLCSGDLVIADASEDYNDVGKCIEVRDLDGERTLAGLHTFIARPKKDAMASGFGGYLMQCREVRLKIMTIAQGTKVLGISKTQLCKVLLPIPSPDEQSKIADFLSAIDRKIESVATQITETQTFKRGLLQQMFV